jgi:hypothetical protein
VATAQGIEVGDSNNKWGPRQRTLQPFRAAYSLKPLALPEVFLKHFTTIWVDLAALQLVSKNDYVGTRNARHNEFCDPL